MTQEIPPPLKISEIDGSPAIQPLYHLILSDNLTLIRKGQTEAYISATTSTGASGTVYAATANKYVVMDLAGDLTDEYRLAQSGNSVSITTAAGLVTINVTTQNITGKQDSITFPLIVGSGGTGITSAFSDGSIIMTSGASGNYTANTAQFMWNHSHNMLAIGRIETGAKLLVSGGFPGGTQVDFQDIFGSVPTVILENTGSSQNRLVFYTNTSRTSAILFCDNRTPDDADARALIDYGHAQDLMTFAVSGGNNVILLRNGEASVGNPPSTVSGIMWNVVGSSRATSVQILGAQATSGGHAVRADRLISTGAGLVGQGDLTSDVTLGISTAGATVGQTLIVSGGSALKGVAWVNTLGGASGTVYAATGNDYVVMNLAADLTSEYRLVQSGNSISITTAAGLLTINATTSDVSGFQDSISFPLGVNSGGTGTDTLTTRGLLIGSGTNAIQALSALNSGELIVGSGTALAPQILPLSAGSQGYVLSANSSQPLGLAWAPSGGGGSSVVYAATANKYVVMDLAADLTAEHRLVQSGNSVSITTAAGLITINVTTQNITTKQDSITFPLIVGSGGTGQTTLTNRGILIGSGTSAIQALGALNSGGLIVGSSTALAPQILALAAGSQGYVLTTNSSQSVGLSWAPSTRTVNTASLVQSSRTISTLYPISGGGNLSVNRTHAVDTAFLITSARTISTVYPISGGGNLGLNRSFAVDTAFLVNTGRTLTAGSGLTGGGNLSADRTFSVNTNVRDKIFGFFAAGTLSTVMLAENARIYAPFNTEIREVRLAVATTPVGANLIVQVGQAPTGVGSITSFYSANSHPIVHTGNAAGIGSGGPLTTTTLFAGSYLGFNITQVGTTETGQNMTITVIARTS